MQTMEHAIIAARMSYVTCHSSLIHNIGDSGEFRLRGLQSIDAPNASGKKFKEYFHLVEDVSPEDCDRIRVNTGALGDSCVLYMALSPDESVTCTVLKFFLHSSRWDLPRPSAPTELVSSTKLGG